MPTKTVGQNVSYETKPGKLIITIDTTQSLGPSKSGKTIGIASTKGNARIENDKGEEIVLGLNLYRKPKEGEI
jgi:hypothetical protein